MGQKETALTGKSRFMIYCPKAGGIYLVEFRTANGQSLAISVAEREDGGAAPFSGTTCPTAWWCRTFHEEHLTDRRQSRIL
jgi:hypothetical protein